MFKQLDQIEAEEKSLLLKSAMAALVVYAVLGLALSVSSIRTAPPVVAEAPLVEAEIVEQKEPPKLYEKAVPTAPAAKVEATVSKDLSKGHAASDEEMKKVTEANNQTAAGTPPPNPTHGPQVEYSPSPKLPSYLKNQNLKGSVLIEFFVSAKGQVTPNLIGSSGNDELDALALKTAKTWIFKPAAKDGQATDAKVRLRINFEVD